MVRIKLNEKSIFVLLISLDIFFIVLSLAHFAVDNVFQDYSGFLLNSNFSIEKDGSYAEIFQYAKEIMITITFIVLFIRTRSVMYFSWAMVFGYLLLDDSLQLHERFGTLISVYFNLSPVAGLRAQDVGELITSAVFGVVLLLFVVIGYYLSNAAHRKISRNILFLLLGLTFFGVFIDMVHVLFNLSYLLRIMGTIEDGGEMFIMSIIVWYAIKLFCQNFLISNTTETTI